MRTQQPPLPSQQHQWPSHLQQQPHQQQHPQQYQQQPMQVAQQQQQMSRGSSPWEDSLRQMSAVMPEAKQPAHSRFQELPQFRQQQAFQHGGEPHSASWPDHRGMGPSNGSRDYINEGQRQSWSQADRPWPTHHSQHPQQQGTRAQMPMLNERHDGGGNGLVGGTAPHNRPGCGYQGGNYADGYGSSCANYGGDPRKYGAGGE